MQFYIKEAILCIFVFLPYIICRIGPIDYPVELARCYNNYHKKTSVSKSVGYQVHFQCYNEYRLKTTKEKKYKKKYQELKKNRYLSQLDDEAIAHSRKKRQAGWGGGNTRRLRKEIRMMTDQERMDYFDVIDTLKHTMEFIMDEDGNRTESRFDLLANFHNGVQVGAHGGCGFGPWHRGYIMMFETACRQVNPTVTVPYYDSTLDFYMDDPRESIIWTDRFLGNGDGLVITGPFANWNTTVGPLTRNVGVSGKLYSEEDITNVVTQTRYGQICGEEAPPETDMEYLHGPIHVYIDGNMGIIETAATDPVFFMHHAFVDYIWEEFRQNSKRNGVNITADYPIEFFGDIFHGPDEPMGIGTRSMREGLSEDFITNVYGYEPRPTCTSERRDCGSKYIKCVDVAGRFRCVSKTLAEYEEGEGGGGGGCTTVAPPVTTTSTTTTSRPVTTTSRPVPTTPKPNKPHPPKERPYLHKPIQNNFCANGKSDTREWVYLPIRVTYSRPPNINRVNSFPILNGKPRKSSDIYSPSPNEYKTFNKYVTPNLPSDYGSCRSTVSGAGEMYIQSDGLNYDGSYREYAIVDHRLAMSMSVAYIAVKAPRTNEPSDVILSAFDSCGRMCHPTCLIPGTNYYRPCSGAIRVSEDPKVPRMYGQSFGNSVLNVWDFNNEGSSSCPQFNIDQIYVSFFCDYSARWPWEHARKQNLPPPPPKIRRPAPQENAIAPMEPQKQKCRIPLKDNRECIIERDDCNAPCKNMEKYQCINICNEFVKCFYKRYYIQRCHRGYFDVNVNDCVKGRGHCTEEQFTNGFAASRTRTANRNRQRQIQGRLGHSHNHFHRNRFHNG